MKQTTIGITDCSRYENYQRWFQTKKGVEVIRLSHSENNIGDIAKCDGVVLSGGEDIHPRLYKRSDYLELCHEIDEKRDEFEWKVLDYTEKHQIPVLGICRGLQVANVYFGGTLIPHIPAFGKFDHSKAGEADRYHSVIVDPNSMLKEIVQATTGETNSAHHQAADRIGEGLVANALSSDGIVEAMERQGEKGSFLLLVQWHPERMKDPDSAFALNIRDRFVEVAGGSK